MATPNTRTKVKILADEEKRDAIVNAFEVSRVLFIQVRQQADIQPTPPQHAYFAYGTATYLMSAFLGLTSVLYRSIEHDAFGWDEYHPISRSGTNLTTPASPDQENLNVGIGYTIIDSLSTLLIMSHSHPDMLLPAYRRAKSWIRTSLDFNVPRDRPVSVFETTIRVLAGLLSADWLEKDYFKLEPKMVYAEEKEGERVLLNTAVDLAWRLSSAFDTASGLPLSLVDLRSREGVKDPDPENKGLVSTAEVGTLQLEFRCVLVSRSNMPRLTSTLVSYLSHLLTVLLEEFDEGSMEKVPQFLFDQYDERLDHTTAPRLWDMVEGVMVHIREGTRGPRLPSVFIK